MTDTRLNSGNEPDWELLARWLAGEAQPDDVRVAEAWAAADPSHRQIVDSLRSWLGALEAPRHAELDVEGALRRVRSRMAEQDSHTVPIERARAAQPIQRSFPLLRAAAVLALLAGSTFAWFTMRGGAPGTSSTGPRTIAAATGKRDSVTLSDGTHVVLAPGSILRVAADFGGLTREVELTGEAFFDVKHDATKMFLVHAGGATIQDVGTTFDVRANAAVDVQVVVTSGLVLLSNGTAQDTVVLHAGDRGTLAAGGRPTAERSQPVADDLAWLQGRLNFRDTSIPEAAAEIRRWYGIELRIADPVLRNRHLTATFDSEPLDQVLKTIALALGATVELRGDTAILHAH